LLSIRKRLEQFNWIARRVLEQNLLAAIPNNGIVAELTTRTLEFLDGSSQVIDLDLKSIPAPGRGLLAVRHRLPSAASSRSVQ
jgi:hypothetical protein